MSVKKTIVAVIPRSHATRNLLSSCVFARRGRVPHPEQFSRRVGIFRRLRTGESVALGHGFSRAVSTEGKRGFSR